MARGSLADIAAVLERMASEDMRAQHHMAAAVAGSHHMAAAVAGSHHMPAAVADSQHIVAAVDWRSIEDEYTCQ